jgi:ABC-type transporter Mla MlaB component
VASTDAGVALRGAVLPEDAVALAALAVRVGEPRPAAPLACDVSELDRPGLATIDTLARIALTCKQRGTSVVVTGAPDSLRALLAFGGLGAYVALAGPPRADEDPG